MGARAMVYKLKAQKRDVRGAKPSRVRATGGLPAIVYGHREAAVPLVLDGHEFRRVFARAGRSHLIDLAIDGLDEKVIVKEVQSHPRHQGPIHVDLYRIDLKEKLEVDVPIEFTGESPIVKLGEGDLLVSLHALKVECLPGDIPESIEADLSGLEKIDDGIRVHELRVPDGVTVLNDPEDLVVKVHARRITVEEEPVAAEGAEVPVAEGEEAAVAEGGQPEEQERS